MTPKQIMAQNPQFEGLWTDEPEHQYGRPVSFYMEANEHNVPAYWDSIEVPVLVIYGEYDWIMSQEDHRMIVESINARKAGLATYFEAPKTTHGLLLANSLQSAFDDYSPDYDPVISQTVISWLESNF
jgi:pimeloyl-ACP methyl ester carboxylesterase